MISLQQTLALLTGIVVLVSLISCAETPMQELEDAREALNRAIEEQAPDIVPLTYARAQEDFLAAEQEIDAQKARWFWERDYSTAIEFLTWATHDGHRAAKEAIEVKRGHSN